MSTLVGRVDVCSDAVGRGQCPVHHITHDMHIHMRTCLVPTEDSEAPLGLNVVPEGHFPGP